MAQANNTFTTPSGVAQYPHLSKPDTKFVPKGQENVNLGSYQTKLILSEKQAEPIIEQINAFIENPLWKKILLPLGRPFRCQ